MSARAVRALLCAALLGALACGGDDDAAESAAARPAAEPESLASEAPPGAGAPAEGGIERAEVATELAPAPAPSSGSQERVGEVLDLDPEGEGLDALIRAAGSDPDPSVREAAVIALGDSDEARALDALIAATEDRDSRVVLAAIDQLGWYDDRLAEDAIRRLVDSPNAGIAEAAREELGE